ncbi:MAG: hypothetical protein ACLQVI_32555 [Polyangiaceae bacterium]
MGSPAAPLTVCAWCGVVCARESKCSHCNRIHEGRPRDIPPRADDAYWVCIECTFKCRACGFDVPLNRLDMDGAVLCVRCGVEQAFEVARWRQALGHAQGVGDLFGDRAAGIPVEKNPFRTVGTSRTSAKLTTDGANALEITASPGHPPCETCRLPLDVEVTSAGRSTAVCKACGGPAAEYGLPAAAQKMMRGLMAIVAAEHRTDRAEVSVEETGAAIAVKCPNCSAPLDVEKDSKLATCKFCKAIARIPDRTWARLSGSAPARESMWLLFRGSSPVRDALDDARERAEAEARRQREKEERHAETERIQAEARAKERAEAEAKERARAAEREEEEKKTRALAEQRGKGVRTVVLIVAVLVALGVGVAWVAFGLARGG